MLYTYRTQQWLPWNNNVCNTCLVTLPPWIWKPSFGSSFSTLPIWFNISLNKTAQETGLYIWRPPERDKDEFHSYTAKSFLTITRSDRFWGGVWSGHRTGIDTPKTVSGGLTWGCGIADNNLTKLVCALPFCIPPCTHLNSMEAKLNLLVTMVGHLITKNFETSATDRFAAVHLEAQCSSTTL